MRPDGEGVWHGHIVFLFNDAVNRSFDRTISLYEDIERNLMIRPLRIEVYDVNHVTAGSRSLLPNDVLDRMFTYVVPEIPIDIADCVARSHGASAYAATAWTVNPEIEILQSIPLQRDFHLTALRSVLLQTLSNLGTCLLLVCPLRLFGRWHHT